MVVILSYGERRCQGTALGFGWDKFVGDYQNFVSNLT